MIYELIKDCPIINYNICKIISSKLIQLSKDNPHPLTKIFEFKSLCDRSCRNSPGFLCPSYMYYSFKGFSIGNIFQINHILNNYDKNIYHHFWKRLGNDLLRQKEYIKSYYVRRKCSSCKKFKFKNREFSSKNIKSPFKTNMRNKPLCKKCFSKQIIKV